MMRHEVIRPHIGQVVRTPTGDVLGEVKELRGDYFKMDAPAQRDYWIRVSDVHAGVETVLEVGFEREDLEAHIVDEPQEAPAPPQV